MTKLTDFLNSGVRDVALGGRGAKTGDLWGIELECEGKRVAWDGGERALLLSWAPHNDGSLRDHHGPPQEWVFNGPVKYDAAVKRVNELFDWFDKRNSKLVCSNRTSTHVHFNMGDKSVYQLVNTFILFTILEELMDRYCGEDRNGNLFCLSSRHAEQQLQWVQDACFQYYSFGKMREDQRYCSLNMAAINKFGTVEFRGMRGLDNRQDMLDWLSILNEFTEYACYKMKNPVDIVQSISQKTPVGFLREIFSRENFVKLTNGVPEHYINQSIFEGLRLVQMLCYRIGTEFDQVRLRGRDFWASFNGDAEPELDVDPEDFADGPLPPKARAGRFVRDNPFLQRGVEVANPWRNPPAMGAVQDAERRAQRAIEIDRRLQRAYAQERAVPGEGAMARIKRLRTRIEREYDVEVAINAAEAEPRQAQPVPDGGLHPVEGVAEVRFGGAKAIKPKKRVNHDWADVAFPVDDEEGDL